MNISLFEKAIKRFLGTDSKTKVFDAYKLKFYKYSFVDCQCESYEQYQASITRLYHTIEKGLSYSEYRAGFGKRNIEMLITSLEQYEAKGFDTSAFFYETAISCLRAYIEKNKQYGHYDKDLENRIDKIPGRSNSCGGTIMIKAPLNPGNQTFKEVMTERHSIRQFSDVPVDVEILKQAIALSQHTPSACNRQGWRTIIIADKNKITKILENQNGNRGFGDKMDKLLVITADLRAQQKNREIFQAFIDGGMYAQSVINSLYCYGVGCVPLSAALTLEQEKKVREAVMMDEAEVLIMFVGVGNYPTDAVATTMSARREAVIEVL